MKKVLVCEVTKAFHLIEIDDEIDAEELIKKSSTLLSRCDDGLEALSKILEIYRHNYGFDYLFRENYAGKVTESLDYVEEID